MKKIVLLLVAICCLSEVYAQQTPLYSQYFDNPLIYNPAYAGFGRFGSVNISHRQQWAGVSSDANMIGTQNASPETSLFSMDIPVYDFTSGVGIQLMKDRIGFLDSYQLKGNYAYHMIGKYVDSSIFSFGVSIGYNHVRSMLPTDAYASYEDGAEYGYIRHLGDPKLLGSDNADEGATFGGGGAYNSVEASLGLNYMYKDKFQVGVALDRLVSQGIRAKDNGTNAIELEPNLLVSLKCTLKTYDELHYVEPQGMVRMMSGMPLQFDAGLQYTYNQVFWVNTMFRSGGKGLVVGADSLSGIDNYTLWAEQQSNFSVLLAMGLKLQRYRLGIASDFMAGGLSKATGSTFEIVFGYKFAHLGRQKYPSPAGRNSKIRFKKRHPSLPGPLSKKRYMGSPKKFRKN